MSRRGSLAIVIAAAGSAVGASTATGAEVLSGPVSSAGAVERSCLDQRLTSGEGYVQRTVTATGPGSVTARLAGDGSGDWDVAVFAAGTDRLIAGSAYGGASEIAAGYVTGATELVV